MVSCNLREYHHHHILDHNSQTAGGFTLVWRHRCVTSRNKPKPPPPIHSTTSNESAVELYLYLYYYHFFSYLKKKNVSSWTRGGKGKKLEKKELQSPFSGLFFLVHYYDDDFFFSLKKQKPQIKTKKNKRNGKEKYMDAFFFLSF